MATITRSLSTKEDGNGRVEFMLRINSNRTTRVRVRSGIFIAKERFVEGKFVYPRANPKTPPARRPGASVGHTY